MASVTDRAICLRCFDWSETSQIVVLLSEHHGKIAATAKGAKRQTPSVQQRFSGGIELASLGEAVCLTKSTRELANLIEWDLIDAFWHLRQRWHAYRVAMLALDVSHAMTEQAEPDRKLFVALHELLDNLGGAAAITDEQAECALGRYLWVLVDVLGYRPMVDADVHSRGALPVDGRRLWFDAEAGGFTTAWDETQARGKRGVWAVRGTTLQALQQMQAGTAGQETSGQIRAGRLLLAYCRWMLGRDLPTMKLLLKPWAKQDD